MSRVLLDHSVPDHLRRCLHSHSVETTYRMGWDTLVNGDLLRKVQASGFDVFVTADKNIPYQQNLSGTPFAVVILGTNLWPVIAAHLGRVSVAVDRATPGSVATVVFPRA